jgi:hypothetical protein
VRGVPLISMMRTLTALAAFLFFISALPRGGRAVSYDTLALGRVGSFALAVEAIDANSQTCGIQKSAIFNAIEYPLVGTGLQVAPTSDIILDVSIVSIIVFARTCVTTYTLSMTAHLPVVFRAQSSFEAVLLWSSSGIISSDVSNHASRFEETLRQEARELVVSWSGARQGRTSFNRR